MARQGRFVSNLKGLQDLGAALGAMRQRRVQVGIFGGKNARTEGTGKGKAAAPETNAEVAAKNELGSYAEGVPRRSFLQMPLFLHGKELFATASKDSVKVLVDSGKAAAKRVELFYKRIGIAAENVVHEAFQTSGWGTWKANAPTTIMLKGSDKPLIDTRQLERAVASRVVG